MIVSDHARDPCSYILYLRFMNYWYTLCACFCLYVCYIAHSFKSISYPYVVPIIVMMIEFAFSNGGFTLNQRMYPAVLRCHLLTLLHQQLFIELSHIGICVPFHNGSFALTVVQHVICYCPEASATTHTVRISHPQYCCVCLQGGLWLYTVDCLNSHYANDANHIRRQCLDLLLDSE